MTKEKVPHDVCWMASKEPGKPAAIAVKMSRDIPLPMPFSVISSPNHMIRLVPAVIVNTIITITGQPSFGMTVLHAAPNRFSGLRANVTNVDDCKTARPMVRYRVYCVILV